MIERKLLLAAACVVAVGSMALLMTFGAGCEKSQKDASTPAARGPSEYANVRCPMMVMGKPIDPAKVTDDLKRDYKGQKVAFCCAACPPKWDKLTDTEKDAKLELSVPKE